MLFVPPSIPFMVPEAEAVDTTPPVISIPSILQPYPLTGYDAGGGSFSATPRGDYILSQGNPAAYSNCITAQDNVAIDTNKSDYGDFVQTYTAGQSGVHNFDNNSGIFCDNSAYWHGWDEQNNTYFRVPFGTTTITCEAWDTSGNKGTASFTIVVTPAPGLDITPPVITLWEDANMTIPISSITHSTTNSSGGYIPIYLSATDDVELLNNQDSYLHKDLMNRCSP